MNHKAFSIIFGIFFSSCAVAPVHADTMFSQFPNVTADDLSADDYLVGYAPGSPNTNYKTTLAELQNYWPFLLSVVGTTNQIVINNTDPLNPIISIANNPIIPGAAGMTLPIGNTAARAGGAGTIRYNSEFAVVEANLDGTWEALGAGGNVNSDGLASAGQLALYFEDAYNITQSALSDSGTVFTVKYGDGSPQFTVSTSGSVQSANSIFDDSAGNMLTGGNISIGQGATPGQTLFMPTNTYDTYSPNAVSSNDGSFSNWGFNSDSFIFTIDPVSTQGFRINAGSTPAFSVNGELDVSTAFNQLDDGVTGASIWADQLNSNGSIQYASKYTLSGTAYDGTTGSGLALALGHSSSDNKQLWLLDPDHIGADANAFQFLISSGFVGMDGIKSITGAPITLNFQGNGALTTFGGDVVFNGQDGDVNQIRSTITSAPEYLPVFVFSAGAAYFGYDYYTTDTFLFTAPVTIQAIDSPITPTTGSATIFTTVDGGTGYSTVSFINDNGDVFPWAEGGGGGSVTEINTTALLSVDSIPGASIITSGTLSISPTAVSANTYQFPQYTVNATGQLTASSNLGFYDSVNSNLFLNGTGISAYTGTTNCTVLGSDTDVGADDLTNCGVFGEGATVEFDNSYSYGAVGTLHGIGGNPNPITTADVAGNFQWNGLYSQDFPPLADQYNMTYVQTDGVVTQNIVSFPIPTVDAAADGSLLYCEVDILAITTDGTGTAYATSEFAASYDGVEFNPIGTVPAIVFNTRGSLSLISASWAVSTGNILVMGTGVNAYYVNWKTRYRCHAMAAGISP